MRPDRDAWERAQTLDDLAELTAQWVEGPCGFHPCYGADTVDPETWPLRATLAGFNRRGFLTTGSQPGQALDADGYSQRAFVDGYAREGVARRLAALTLHTDLLVLAFRPGEVWGYQIPVTVDGFRPYTWSGGCWGAEDLEHFARDCSAQAMQALAGAWAVIVIDPQWGRTAYLWDHVAAALNDPRGGATRYSVTPTHALELGTDFVN
jgi:hypothetical protein